MTATQSRAPQSRILVLATSNLLLAKLGLLDTRTSVALETTSRSTEVAEGLASSAAATEEDGVGAGGLAHSELVEGEALTTGLQDACASRVGETKSADGHLGDVEHASVVNNGGDDNCGLLGVPANVTVDAREGHDRAVVTALHETLADLNVEGRASTTSKELVQTHKKSHVGICALSVLAHMLLLVSHVQLIDCHFRLSTKTDVQNAQLTNAVTHRTTKTQNKKKITNKKKDNRRKNKIKIFVFYCIILV